MIRVLTPSLLIQLAVISPAGPDPTIRTSTVLLFVVAVSILSCLLTSTVEMNNEFPRSVEHEIVCWEQEIVGPKETKV